VPGNTTSTHDVRNVRRTVGRYEIVREVGRGGMATVYLARQIDLERDVALKELGALRAEDPKFVKRFLREAQLAGSLSHSHVVTVHDYFEYEGVPYIAMEYLDRGSVRPWVGTMSRTQIGGVLRDVLAGLGAAEKHDIVHRDLKPENLMVTSEGRVKIADFGIAKATNQLTGAFMTSTGIAVGTPNYIAPEQARAKEVGPWTDLYALGVMAFEFYVGKAPFADTEEPMAVLLRQVNDPIPAVNELDPSVDRQISEWIEWLTSKKPGDRPQCADQARQALEDILVSTLGPYWARRAPLLAAEELPPEVPPPRAAAPVAAVPTPTFSERPTNRLDEAQIAPTMAPAPRPVGAAADSRTARTKSRWRPFVIGAVTAVALVAMIAAALSPAGGGGSQPAAGSGAASAPLGAEQTAAVQNVQGTPPPSASATDKASLAKGGRDARALARQYESAAAEIESLGSGSASTASLMAALRQTARAYDAAATAADRGDAAGYTTSIAAALEGKNAVQSALGAGGSGSAGSGTGSVTNEDDPGGDDERSDDPSDEEGGGGEP
jgi:Protein kinase domain